MGAEPATDLDGRMACQGWGLEVARTTNGFFTVEEYRYASSGNLRQFDYASWGDLRQLV